MSKKDSLGDRMKSFEDVERRKLTKKVPVIIRLDGKAFHTFTRGSEKPFDRRIIKAMQDTTEFLMRNIQGAKFGYVQSDEISLLILDTDSYETSAWFDYNVQKMASISASMAAVQFSEIYRCLTPPNEFKPAYFDARIFNLPKFEVPNYFRWRFQDWKRNSVSMLAQSMFSHKKLQGKNSKVMKEMCKEEGTDWETLEDHLKFGTSFFFDKDETGKSELLESAVDMSEESFFQSFFKEFVDISSSKSVL